MSPARHQIIASAFRRSAGEDRRFNIQKAVAIQVIAQNRGDFAAQAQFVGNLVATQIQETVAQTHVLAHIGVTVELEGRGFRSVEDFQFLAQHFNLTSTHIGVDRGFGAGANPAFYLQHVLAAHLVSALEVLFSIRVEHHLNDAIAIAQIQEDNAAVIPAPVYPTT